MANIARGQITIVDLNDGKSINLFLSSNQPATQIFNQENSSYVPNYPATNLVISPEVYVSGTATNQVASLKGTPVWKINGSTTLNNFGATAATTSPYNLTIKNNLSNLNALSIECTVIYVDPDTGAETTAKAVYTVTKVTNTGQSIRAIAYAPNGTVFKNGNVASLKAHCDLWRGSAIDNTSVSYKWQVLDGTWKDITTANANGITNFNTNEITIPAASVLNFASYKCIITDTDPSSGTRNTSVADIISFADMSDPYSVDIEALAGTTLTSGNTSTTLKVNVWQNGNLLPDSFFTGLTCTWQKYNKDGALDNSWGTSGTKTGRTLTVTKEEVAVKATYIVTLSK